jgi:hypothetical protein
VDTPHKKVVIYGSTLFLTAVAAALEPISALIVEWLPLSALPATIIDAVPDVLLYQSSAPPPATPNLLAADIVLAEIDGQQNTITQYRRQQPPITQPVRAASDLLSLIDQCNRKGVRHG